MNKKILISLVLTLFLENYQVLFAQTIDANKLSMDSCIQIALINNYGLQVYKQDKEITKKQYAIQKGKLLPTISLASEYQFSDQFSDLDRYSSGSASIQVYQPIWQDGKIKATINQALVNTEVSEIEYSIRENDIIYYTTVEYIDLLRNSKIKELTIFMLKQFEITLDAAKERYKLGASRRTDVLKAETELSNIQNLTIQIETTESIAKQNLLNNIGYPINQEIKTVDFLVQKDVNIETIGTDSLTAIANSFLPELKLINKQIEQQELTVIIERKSQFPEISAFAGYNWIDNPMYSKDFYGSIGLSMRLNIFNGFQKRNKIAMERISLQQLNYKEEEIKQLVLNEIQISQLRLTEALEKITNAQVRTKSSKETLEMTTEEYRQGLSSMLELIDAQYTDYEAQRDLIDAQAEYHLALATLKRKTGFLLVQYKN